ncbi:hypothetical protein CEXT_470901 [Caerostris extrusa]|uniref:Uncharacterized protein n=1 Tax=Caerostris extrusa TaxID=172846 RepID=A0AAV4QZF1_CAEEX|nr:hypothetical protein CEXT_470901 [Caerostris extrusa]
MVGRLLGATDEEYQRPSEKNIGQGPFDFRRAHNNDDRARMCLKQANDWKEYLLQLRIAHNFANPSSERNLKSGDIVPVEGHKKSKIIWYMGVVEKVIVGRDDHVLFAHPKDN